MKNKSYWPSFTSGREKYFFKKTYICLEQKNWRVIKPFNNENGYNKGTIPFSEIDEIKNTQNQVFQELHSIERPTGIT